MKPKSVKEEIVLDLKDKKIIAAFSCLVHKEKVKSLGEVLGKINSQEGYAVRFTGPWAPFSFVNMEEI